MSDQSQKPRALVIRAPGTNCDTEMCRAFELAGAQAELVHVDRLIAEPGQIERFDLIGFPGGFSYGDDIASGRILAMRLRERLYPALHGAARRGVPMIGACNGFQVLVQVGLLPGRSSTETDTAAEAPRQTCSLAHNIHGRFVDRWVGVRVNPRSPCIWTQNLAEAFGDSSRSGDVMMLPIAHGEGRFVTDSKATLDGLIAAEQIAITYTENPNGSTADIAGICDPSGRILGLMPHPERYLEWTHHPFFTRLDLSVRKGMTPGLMMFKNAAAAAVTAGV